MTLGDFGETGVEYPLQLTENVYSSDSFLTEQDVMTNKL